MLKIAAIALVAGIATAPAVASSSTAAPRCDRHVSVETVQTRTDWDSVPPRVWTRKVVRTVADCGPFTRTTVDRYPWTVTSGPR